MKIHHFTVEEALKSLHSTPEGLSTAEAKRRLLEFGFNRVEQVKGEPIGYRFARSFVHFFAIILWVAAVLAFLADRYDPGSRMSILGFAIVGVIVINGLFSFWQEYRAEQALAMLQKLLPHQVDAMRDGKVHQIPAEELAPGDVIELSDGENIPADCRILQAFGVRVNNGTVTGESVPQSRDERPDSVEELLHSRNVLLAGTSLVAGRATAVVFATGMHTEFGMIAHLSQNGRESLSPLQKEIARLSWLVAALATVLGIVFFLVGLAVGLSFWENLLFAIGIIVANVPEGLLPTVTLALAMGSQRMAKRNALIRRLPSVETLGSASVICTDKTGTLTQNRMSVHGFFLSGQFYPAADPAQISALPKESEAVFRIAIHCHTLKSVECDGEETLSGDPMEVALLQAGQAYLSQPALSPRVDEIPFDSDRKRLSTLHRSASGLVLYSKGALETLLPLCSRVRVGSDAQPLTSEWKQKLLDAQDAMGRQGLRVLALAWRSIPEEYERDRLEEEMTLAGLVGLQDPPRPETPEAIRKCRQAGIKVIMVTGDHPQTALAVAQQIGLVETPHPVVMVGDQLRRLSNTQLRLALRAGEILFARVSAGQKMRIVKALQAQKHIVAVTGDGVNDAPALRQADIGIAMGRSGTDVARASADMILLDDNFATIVAAIEEGRAVFDNIRKFMTYILASNVPELIPYLAFVLFRIPLALPIIQILAVDLGTDMLPALALGAEKPDPQTMNKPPRSPSERLLNWPLLARSYCFLGPMEAAAAMTTFLFILYSGGWRYGEPISHLAPLYLQATTGCLTAIVIMQVANLFTCRSERRSALTSWPFGNRLLVVGIGVELLLIVLIAYTALGNSLFNTAPISGTHWLVAIPFALGMLALDELRKWILRRRVAKGDRTQFATGASSTTIGKPVVQAV